MWTACAERTGIRPPWGKMTGVRPVRLIHDKRAAGWTEADIDRFFLERFDCSRQKYGMAKAIADLQEPILKLGSAPKTYGRQGGAEAVQHLYRRRHPHQPVR